MSGNCNCLNPLPGGCAACNPQVGYFGYWPNPVYPTTPGPMQRGWECPACGLGNAPWSPYCTHCKDKAARAVPSPSGKERGG